MKNISEFFKRIGGVQAKEMAVRTSIQASIKEFVDIDIPLGSITLTNGVIKITHISQAAKSVLYIHKQQILDRANTLLPDGSKARNVQW